MTVGSGGQAGRTYVATYRPDGTQPRWLGMLGHVTPPVYSYSLPGGCNQLTCTLEKEPTFRSDALNPGRLVRAYRGGSVVWNGTLLEPTYGQNGWQISANGSGNWGSLYQAVFNTWTNQNDAVNQAIARGLGWTNTGIPGDVWLGQVQDTGSLTITDLLNLFCTKGGLTWYVDSHFNRLSVYPWATAPVTRLLTSVEPVARTLGGDYNALYGLYTTQADINSSPEKYSLASVTTPASITEHGRMEAFADLTNAGVLSQGQTQQQLQNILNLYQRASFSGPFNVRYGELMTTGGFPIDLGTEQAGQVVQLQLLDFGYGGEITPGPVSFVVGSYQYDDTVGTAQITPFQSLDLSMSGLLSTLGLAGGSASYESAHKGTYD